MPDHKLLPGGKMSRDPSPKPAKRAPPERDCEAIRRAESEHLKMREKTRDTFDRYYEKDKGSRLREEDREWKERERKREEERRKNGRTPENVEETGREVKGGFKKGDTFPRMRKGDADLDRRVVSSIETIEDRGGRREKDRPRRGEIYEWEPEGERKWEREKYRERQREETRVRLKDEDKTSGGRSVANERFRDREQYRMFDDGFRNRQGKEFALRDMRDKDTTYRRDKPRTYISDREARIPSPHRRKAKEMYTDSRERDKTQRDGRRDTKSEGDNDEREIRREKVRDREKKEFIYQQSKSEEDTRSKNTREKDQHWQRYRDEDRHRYRDREVDSFMRKGDEKQRERHSEDNRQATRLRDGKDEFREDRNFKDDKVQLRDRREDERYRERRQKRDGERRDIETLHRGQEKKSEDSQSRDEQTLGLPPRAQSSGEWSSDMDSEVRRRGDSYVDSNFQREHSAERKRHKDQHRDMDRAQRERMRCEQKEGRRREVAGSEAERRRMWLDPQKGNDSKEEIIDRGQKERMKNEEKNIESQVEQRKAKEEQNERYMDQSNNKEIEGWSYKFGRDLERESKEVSVDEEDECQLLRQVDMEDDEYLSDSDGEIERSYPRYIEGENVTDDTEESDTGEVGGTDNWVRSENEVGSDAEWRHGQDKMLSGEDGFVTVSSGADEDYERDSDEDEFKDCQEFLEGGMAQGDHQPVGFKGHQGDEEMRTGREGKGDDVEQQREKPLVFCVIGQTIPRSNTRQISPSQGDHRVEGNDPDLESRRLVNNTIHPPDDDHHLTLIQNDKDVNNDNCNVVRECGNPKEEFTKGQHSDKDIYRASSELQGGESKAEMRSKEEDRVAEIGVNLEEIQPMLDQLNSGLMSPEEVEAIRIRLSGAWSMSEEPKRHSQAPHLKWAKNVVREILGHSDEQIVDESNTEDQENKKIYLSEMKQQERIAQGTEEMTVFTLTVEEQHSDAELDDEVEGLRGMGQRLPAMHADKFTAMHVITPTCTHADTPLDMKEKKDDKEDKMMVPSLEVKLEEADVARELGENKCKDVILSDTDSVRENEVKMYLSVSNTLYKPNSCPILNYECESDELCFSRDGEIQEQNEEVAVDVAENGMEWQVEEFEEKDAVEEMGGVAAEKTLNESGSEEEVVAKKKTQSLSSSCSFRDLGPEARLRRRGIRKTTERRNGNLVEMQEEESVGRDRRTRIFTTADEDDDRSKSWGEVELRNVLETINRRKRNSRFFNDAQLYQQYSEEAQNFEILRQTRSEVLSVCEYPTASPAPSPPPACRPLPPLPPVPHPHSISHTGSITSVKSLPLPEPPTGRSTSPRLSISLTQSASLWRDLPAVRNSTELEDFTDDQRRLQEVRFEVVTSEASYCRSLDIVVEHFVKSKQLNALLGTQDRNWLFSRLADVRAISHSFLSKLEERVESNMMHFTVCDIIAKHCQRFKMVYVPYLTNQSYQDATYQRLMNENPGFRRIVEKLERSPVCQRLPLRSFLVLPFQRITRIKLLVQNIVKRTAPGTAEAMQGIKALRLVEKLIQESNDSITQMKSIESLVSLSAKVDFECRTLPLISQSRRMVREGLVTELMDFSLKDTERNVYMHLFNDYLLLSLQKEGRYLVIDHAPVSELRAENCRVKLHSLQKNLFKLHMSGKALLLRTDTQSDKLRWISALSRPHPEIDFSAAQDFAQMQCIRAFVAQQPDELSLEKADVILVHQQSSDNWVEGTRLSDRHRGWVPNSHLETITNSRVRQRNLSDALKLTTATAAV
ncbi:trichohyalin isoform X2 [Gouania willdenowi]|uniref:trichohyalin isoform X2 n=1 Tax=Gouania willdenowi TaxID=441366 RepID=UPI0010556C34|nr:trichohyalin-like isoform X2 [Gouania willdenowi]